MSALCLRPNSFGEKEKNWFGLIYISFFQMETRGFVRKILEEEYVGSRQWSVFVYIQMNQVVGGNVSWRTDEMQELMLRRCDCWDGVAGME